MTRSVSRLGVAMAISLLAAGAASAQSTGRLYDAMPPANSSYLRVVSAGTASVDVWVDGKLRTRGLKGRTPSAYLILSSGAHNVQLRSGTKIVGATAVRTAGQAAYTVALPQGSATPVVFTDKLSSNKLKSVLAVYNLAPGAGALTVSTADGKTKVFTGVRMGQPAVLEVNPIQVNLQVAGTAAKSAASLRMVPGGSYSVFAFPNGVNGLTTLTVQNTNERYLGN